MAFSRTEVLGRLRRRIDDRQPIVMGGAGIGLVAKAIDRAGIDVIMAYNTGPFRMDGHGSLAGYLAYGDSNAITLELAAKILPVVEDTPVVGGIGAADPYRPMESMIDAVMAAGYSGVTNVPTAGIYDGTFRQQIDHTGLGYPREIELIAKCRARDIFTVAYAFDPDEARRMAEAGADVIGAHVGLTTGGLIGAGIAADIDEACARTARMRDAAVAARADVIVVAHGGPFEDPASVQACYDRADVHGFLGASSIERLPVERALAETVAGFRRLTLRPR
ncbi:MAG TPA: phosphoenolpyruvate hydrolase family protein [Lichenihabitans sp.]|jgi:predicted TIM-barrel enzyme|nr:phosphoenolpyruvate hydrolase family protein [Lichenihabitans sp.]